jgi:serine/threonine-protein kinase
MILDLMVMPLYTRQGAEVEIPDLVGMTVEQAKQVADEQGFRIEEAPAKLGGRAMVGTVLEQRPLPKAMAKPGRIIRVVPAKEGASAEIPDLTGLNQRDAEISCRNIGLMIAPSGTTYDFSAIVPRGAVMRQRPEPGAPVREGQTVQVTISLGSRPNSLIVPSLIEISLHEARQLILEAGLQVGKITRKETDVFAAGTVIAQSHHAGEEVEHDTQIDLVVAVPVRDASSAESDTPPPQDAY